MRTKSLSICSHSPEVILSRNFVKRIGSFCRSSDGVRVQRYFCKRCGKSFSEATFSSCYWQKKRQFNLIIFKLLASNMSQRRSALLTQLNRKTVVRKFLFLSGLFLPTIESAQRIYPISCEVQFDDLETFEHTKYKPLSVTMAVDGKSRRILGFGVAEMPAKGLLSELSLKKYGVRPDQRAFIRKKLFEKIKPLIAQDAVIKSDQSPHYVKDVKNHFPGSIHLRYKGRKPSEQGQGELKGANDPLFTLNHTFAMLRANISRLIRKTWCTTKKKERLELHLALYASYHNHIYLNQFRI